MITTEKTQVHYVQYPDQPANPSTCPLPSIACNNSLAALASLVGLCINARCNNNRVTSGGLDGVRGLLKRLA